MKKLAFDLEERLIDFAVAIIKFDNCIRKSNAGSHLSNQVIRSGSSAALNYGEAQAAESKRDFVHKMKICLKELRETQVCLKILVKSGLTRDPSDKLLSECSELVAIFTKSVSTATR